MKYNVTPGQHAEVRWVDGDSVSVSRELIPEGPLAPMVTRDGVEWIVRTFHSEPHPIFILVPPPAAD